MRLLGPNAISLPLPDTPLSQVSGLSETLAKKEAEMAGMEERYKKYIEKAKSVIKTLDPKQNPSGAPEVSALKNQLQVRVTIVALVAEPTRAHSTFLQSTTLHCRNL